MVFGKSGGFAAAINLSTFDGNNGFRLDGVAANHSSGNSLSSAGDVNGDGFDDLIIGAQQADPNGRSSGSSYVVFGKSGGFAATINLSSLTGTNGFRLDGVATYNDSGTSVSSAGDVNGDGFDDLIIGAHEADPNGTSSGSSYVVFGKSGGFALTLNLSALDGTTGFRMDGVAADDRSGRSVSSAGDINGDGFDDLIVGAYRADGSRGRNYVVFGKSGGFASTINLTALDGTTGFRLDGVANSDLSGRSVSSAGDVNGDGFDDLIFAARGADPNGSLSGSSYVVFGKSGGFAATINLSTLDGTTGFRLDGVAENDLSGVDVRSAGDVNGDGFDDLIVGASGADPNGSYSGSSYLIFGKSGGFAATTNLSTLDGTTGFRLDGVAENYRSGFSVNRAGDVNGDGFDDLIIGAYQADPDGIDSGSSYVVFGKSGGFAATLDLSALNATTGFRLDGIDTVDRAGFSVSSLGDVNGDGFDDLIVGGYRGRSYVVFGGNLTGGVETQVAGDTNDTLNANQGPGAIDVLIGGQGNDILISDGGSDVLLGGEGDDVLALADIDFSGTRRLVGGNGTDTLRLDGSGLHLNFTTIPDNRIVDIEKLDIFGNKLTLNQREVLNLSSTTNSLIVRRSTGSTVNIGSGWMSQPDELIDGINFNVVTQGAATLKIQSVQNDPPVVSSVIASSSQWLPNFIDAVDGGGTGTGNGIGIELNSGALPIPHDDVNRLYIQFSETINNLDASSLELRNSTGPLPFTFSYNATTFVATISVATPLPFGKYRLAVSDQVTDESGNPLDGDASGQAGGVFNLRFDVLPGDTSGDGRVGTLDLTPFGAAFNAQPGQSLYNPRLDWNGDSRVSTLDLVVFSANFNRRLSSLDEPGVPFEGGGGGGAVMSRAMQVDKFFSNFVSDPNDHKKEDDEEDDDWFRFLG